MEEDNKEYRWETGYEKTWEAITEDSDGLLEFSVQELIQKAKRKRMLDKSNRCVRLGMMRHLFLIIDASECMSGQDLKPTRFSCILKLTARFLEEFFYLNPISQVGVIVTRNKRAELVSDLAGNPRKHLENLKKMQEEGIGYCKGEPSLQNSLELALNTLKNMPAHASRELVVLFGSLTTCDPGDIEKTIEDCKKQNLRCSVISLAAEVRIYRELTKVTRGEFGVVLDDLHLRDLLYSFLEPPASADTTESSLIKMGFPCHAGQSQTDSQTGLGMCMCHLDQKTGAASDNPTSSSNKLTSSGFLCPQCNSKYCELPVECKTCGLTLVSAPHLARSYHHLFPLPTFIEVSLADVEQMTQGKSCFSCVQTFLRPSTNNSETSASGAADSHKQRQVVYKCPKCRRLFCCDCDIFIHETLHTCPGCSSARNHVGTNGRAS